MIMGGERGKGDKDALSLEDGKLPAHCITSLFHCPLKARGCSVETKRQCTHLDPNISNITLLVCFKCNHIRCGDVVFSSRSDFVRSSVRPSET